MDAHKTSYKASKKRASLIRFGPFSNRWGFRMAVYTGDARSLWAAYYSTVAQRFVGGSDQMTFQVFSQSSTVPLLDDYELYNRWIKRTYADTVISPGVLSSLNDEMISTNITDVGAFSPYRITDSYRSFLQECQRQFPGSVDFEIEDFRNKDREDYHKSQNASTISKAEDQGIQVSRGDVLSSRSNETVRLGHTEIEEYSSETKISGSFSVPFFKLAGSAKAEYQKTEKEVLEKFEYLELGFGGLVTATVDRGSWFSPAAIRRFGTKMDAATRSEFFGEAGILPGVSTAFAFAHRPFATIKFGEKLSRESLEVIKASARAKFGPFPIGRINYGKKEASKFLEIDENSLTFKDETDTIYSIGCSFFSFRSFAD